MVAVGSAVPGPPAMQVRVLGPLELANGGTSAAIRRGRPRRLFLALLVRAGQPVSTDTLIEDLWNEEPPQNAANALQILVSYLRKTLGASHGRPRIETVEGGYRLEVDDDQVDAVVFERAVRDLGSITDPTEQLAAIDGALALWRGEPYAEATYDGFAQGEIRRLNELRLLALEARMDVLLDLGQHREATTELHRLVAAHPLHERFHAQLMVALYRSGRQADALRAYESARATLVEELGLDPSPELRRLASDVLDQAPSLDHAEPARPPRPAAPPTTGEPVAADGAQTPWRETSGRLIGRDHDIERLVQLLPVHGLVTLTGPGGAGKTRIAVAVAERLARAGSELWWADLGGAVTDVDIVTTIATAVGAPSQPGDTGDVVTAHLSGRRGVLVLDTCEHVVAGVRGVVGRLRRDAGGIEVLATSRQPLRVSGELPWPVSPLSLPASPERPVAELEATAAVELFVDRAKQAHPHFTLTPAIAPHVARAVLLLDGLPLAIELAAAHTAVVSPAKLVDLLADRLRVLVDDRRVDRQHALRATIDWSYDLLDEHEARFFERLAVFTGPFSVDAAALVAGDTGRDGFQLLVALVRQSLLAPAGSDRFRLLDTIRAYAQERLRGRGRDEIRELRDRHAAWYADFAAEADRGLRGPDSSGWLADLRAELPNLRAALQHAFTDGSAPTGARMAASLAWFWSIEGVYAEAARWLSAAVAVAPADSALAADVLAGLALHAASLGELRDAAESADAAARIYEQVAAEASLARTLVFLGIAHWGLGDLDAATSAHERALGIFRGLRDPWGHGLALVVRARTAADQGDDDLAVRLLDAALPIARRSGDAHVVALCLEQRARAAVRGGQSHLARELAVEAVETNERVGYAEGVAAARFALGHAASATGDLEEAAQNYGAALRIALEIDLPGAVAEGLESLASLHGRRGDASEATRLLAGADAVRDRAGLPRLRTHELTVGPAVEAEAQLDEEARRAARTAGRLLDTARLVDELLLADSPTKDR